MGYKHNKMVYEDICTRKTAPFEIIFTRVHFLCSTIFVITFLTVILTVSIDLKNRFDQLNDFYINYWKFKFGMQRLSNNYLYKLGLDL